MCGDVDEWSLTCRRRALWLDEFASPSNKTRWGVAGLIGEHIGALFSARGTGLASRSTGMCEKCVCVIFARVVRHKRPPRGSTLHSSAVSCFHERTFCGGFACFAQILEAMCPVEHMHDSEELFATSLDLSLDCGVFVRSFLVLLGEWLEETNRTTFGRAVRRIAKVRVKSLRKSS